MLIARFRFLRMTVIRRNKIALQVIALAAIVHAPLGWSMLSAAGAADKPAASPNSSAAAPSTPAAGTRPAVTAAQRPAIVDNMPRAPGTSKGLPAPVADMREALLAAVASGSIDDLALPLSWNELKPDVADKVSDDPIGHWKKVSGDGNGREVLAVLGRILDMRAARLATGSDPENTAVYVWPYLAELDLSTLKPAEEVDLYRLMSPAEAKAMRDGKRWTWWRLAIGADGTWHSFRRAD